MRNINAYMIMIATEDFLHRMGPETRDLGVHSQVLRHHTRSTSYKYINYIRSSTKTSSELLCRVIKYSW